MVNKSVDVTLLRAAKKLFAS